MPRRGPGRKGRAAARTAVHAACGGGVELATCPQASSSRTGYPSQLRKDLPNQRQALGPRLTEGPSNCGQSLAADPGRGRLQFRAVRVHAGQEVAPGGFVARGVGHQGRHPPCGSLYGGEVQARLVNGKPPILRTFTIQATTGSETAP